MDRRATHPFVLLSGHHDTWYFGVMDNGRPTPRCWRWRGSARHARGCSAACASASGRAIRTGAIPVPPGMSTTTGTNSTAAASRMSMWIPPAASARRCWRTRRRWRRLHELAAEAVTRSRPTSRTTGKRKNRARRQSFVRHRHSVDVRQRQRAGRRRRTARNALGWWWHTPHDLIDKVDEANQVRDARVLGQAVWRLLCGYHPAAGPCGDGADAAW